MNELRQFSKGNSRCGHQWPIRQALRRRWGWTHIGPTQSKWYRLTFCIGRENGCLTTNNPERKTLTWLEGSEGATKPFNTTHHSRNNQITAAVKRDPAPWIRPIYHKLIESEWWDEKKEISETSNDFIPKGGDKKEPGCEAGAEQMKACKLRWANSGKGRMDQSVWSRLLLWSPVVQRDFNLRLQIRLQIRMQNIWWVHLGSKYTSTKLQSTINERNKQCSKWAKRKPISWKAIGRRVIELTNSYEIANPRGRVLNKISQHNLLSWKPAANTTNSQHEQCAYEFFSISMHPRWILMKTVGRTVVKGVVIHWYWGGIVGLSVGGALRGDGNGRRRFLWWSSCANKTNESAVVGLMGIAG